MIAVDTSSLIAFIGRGSFAGSRLGPPDKGERGVRSPARGMPVQAVAASGDERHGAPTGRPTIEGAGFRAPVRVVASGNRTVGELRGPRFIVLNDIPHQNVRIETDHRRRPAVLAMASSIAARLTGEAGFGTMPFSCVTEAVTGTSRTPSSSSQPSRSSMRLG